MAYIAPNSTVQLFGNLNLSDNYHDSLYFASTNAKDTYFDGLTKLANKSALSYTREQRGYVRLEVSMASVVSARYMRFKNTSFENKWFYAFVKNVEYINNNCTQINFELDPLMTWMGAFTLGQCFIVRQHTVGDAIGANIAEENFNLGLYVCEGTETFSLGDPVIVIYKTYRPPVTGSTGSYDPPSTRPTAIQQGTYNPLAVYTYPLDSANIGLMETNLNTWTTDNRIDEVVTAKLVPDKFISSSEAVPEYSKSVAKPYTTTGASSYTPRNKKLFTYPYKYLKVENCEGESTVYKYEYFNTRPDSASTGNCNFKIIGAADNPEIAIMCTPTTYNGISEDFDQSICMRHFPAVAWNVDSYAAYIAQRDSSLFGNVLASIGTGAMSGALQGAVVSGGVGAVPGAVAGAARGAIGSGMTTAISDTINEMLSGILPARMPDQTRGRSETDLMMQYGTKKFYFRQMCITKNYAMMIDDFFDMYGYAIKQVGTPNMNARPYWTYVKTIGCDVGGAIPADDASAIESIFNNGIRFWKNHNNIGNFTGLNNSPA